MRRKEKNKNRADLAPSKSEKKESARLSSASVFCYIRCSADFRFCWYS